MFLDYAREGEQKKEMSYDIWEMKYGLCKDPWQYHSMNWGVFKFYSI